MPTIRVQLDVAIEVTDEEYKTLLSYREDDEPCYDDEGICARIAFKYIEPWTKGRPPLSDEEYDLANKVELWGLDIMDEELELLCG